MRAPRLHRTFAFALVASLLGAAPDFAAATPAPAAARVALVLNDPDHGWRVTPVARPASPKFLIDQVLQPATGRSRIVVVSSRVVDGTPDSLENFARAIKLVFAPGAGPNNLDTQTTRLGFVGHELHFPLTRESETFDCELFVFADGPSQHGILCAAAQNDPAAAYSLLSRLQRQVPAPASTVTPDGIVALAPFKVHDSAVSDFSIGFRIIGSREHRRVVKLIVNDLPASSSTPPQLELGDEIAAIDGRPAQEFDSSIGRDTELGRIFLNRRIGDSVTLDLISARNHEPYSVTLRVEDFRLWLKR